MNKAPYGIPIELNMTAYTHLHLCTKFPERMVCEICDRNSDAEDIRELKNKIDFTGAYSIIVKMKAPQALNMILHMEDYSEEFLLWIASGSPRIDNQKGMKIFREMMKDFNKGKIDIQFLFDKDESQISDSNEKEVLKFTEYVINRK